MRLDEDDLDVPLTQTELEELESFLEADGVPEGCMNLEMLDGFLAAIVVGPEPIMPSEWLPQVWSYDEEEGAEPIFRDDREAARIHALILRHMNSIASVLAEAPEEYSPVFYEYGESEPDLLIAQLWSWGFIAGMDLRHQQWQFLTGDEESADMVMPIFALAAEEDDAELGAMARDPEKRAALVEVVADCVVEMYDFWAVARERPDPIKRQGPKVGRNDPCPCGSGKKYKNCCGA
jgi:uncharacterized protein